MIREFMLEELKDAGFNENVRDDESLIDLAILDSLTILQLISFMDQNFGIIPDPDEIAPEKVDTINRIEEFIANKLNINS